MNYLLSICVLTSALLVSCNSDSPTSQTESKYVEVKASSMTHSFGGELSESMISDMGPVSQTTQSSELGVSISSGSSVSINSSISSSSEFTQGLSSGVAEPLDVLFQKFPFDVVKPSSSFDLSWISSGSSSRLVSLFISVNKAEFELLSQDLSANEYTWVISGLENGDRVQLKIGVYEPLVSSDTLWDQTGLFDVHSGETLLEYEKDIQPIIDTYCTECHGGAYSEGGYKISNYSNLVKGNNEKYAVNRMSLIQDMPPVDYEHQPDSLARWQLRDWVLGGSPE